MNKKLITPIVLIALVCLSILVNAGSMIETSNGNYDVEISLEKGWNIIPGISPEDDAIASNSEIQKNDISVIWYYSPIQQKYFEIYPNFDKDALNDDDDFVLTNAMWIYSEKSGTIKYNTLEDYLSLDERQLYSGWNFVTMTPDVIATMFEEKEISGNCDIEKSYFFNSEKQEWVIINVDNLISGVDGSDDEDYIGLGWVVKVSSDCKLGSSSSSISAPSLPE